MAQVDGARMESTDPVRDLENQILSWWRNVSRLERFDECSLRPSPAVTARDAASFLRGLRWTPSPLFGVTAQNVFQCRSLPRHETRRLAAFEARVPAAWFRAETIVHHAALTELIAEHGWAQEQVICEPDVDPEFSTGLDASDPLRSGGSLDIVTVAESSRGRRYMVGVEAKGDARSLASLIEEMKECRGAKDGAHARKANRLLTPSEQSLHRKCRGLLHYRPVLFWAVAPGVRDLYLVSYSGRTFKLSKPGPNAQLASLLAADPDTGRGHRT
jgi:hypothetical protein